MTPGSALGEEAGSDAASLRKSHSYQELQEPLLSAAQTQVQSSTPACGLCPLAQATPKTLWNRETSRPLPEIRSCMCAPLLPKDTAAWGGRIISYGFKPHCPTTFALTNYERFCLCRWMQRGLDCQQESAGGST